MVFVGEYQHFGRNSAEGGGIECHFALRGENAVVQFSVGDENGGVPFVDEAMWRVGECGLCRGIVLFPVCTAHVPVGKPHFFGFEILGLSVEYAGMSYERGKSAVMMSCEPVDGESAIACSDSTYVLLVKPRFGLDTVDGAEVVAHVLTAVVA